MKHPAPPSKSPPAAALDLEVARLRAMYNIQDAARILTEATVYVPADNRQLWTSIVGGLNTLERHIVDLKSI